VQNINNIQQLPGSGQPDDGFSKFIVNDFIIEIAHKRVKKCFTRQLEGNIMFAKVGRRFTAISLESDVVKRVYEIHQGKV
jgi:hypothetical protein